MSKPEVAILRNEVKGITNEIDEKNKEIDEKNKMIDELDDEIDEKNKIIAEQKAKLAIYEGVYSPLYKPSLRNAKRKKFRERRSI